VHPLTDFADQLHRPAESAKASGYRMPGEFEPVEAVWLTYPHNAETWPGCMDEARQQYDFFMSQVARFADVQLTGKRHGLTTNDAWIRDYGPIFVVNDAGDLACHDFVFNGWGGKYGDGYGDDDCVPQHVARLLDIPVWIHDLVLEGGSIDVNGMGTVMTTEQCLLNPNRNPQCTRKQIEQQLHDALGTRHVIWLPGGIEGDDTDGHIDDVARFIAPDTVVAVRAPEDHPDHATLERNWQALQQGRDQDGQPPQLIALPAPSPMQYDYPPDRFGPGGVALLPASYANFVITNNAVFVPTFSQPTDDEALRILDDALAQHSIIGIRSEHLIVGMGALHCLTQQQPRV